MISTLRRNMFTASTLLALGLALALGPALADASPPPPAIRLQYATFDPLDAEPAMPVEATPAPDGPTLYLLQFAGPVHADWKAAVEAAGARLYGYIPDYAFIARMDEATAARVRTLSFVRWVGLYHPAYRLASELQNETPGPERVTVSVQALPDVDLDALSRAIETLGGEILAQSANPFAGYLRVRLPANRLPDLAAQDGVLWVEPYLEPELYNNVGGGQIMRADEVRGDLGLYGSGQIVAVADTGLDTGQDTLSADFKPQFIKAYALGRPTTNDWSDNNAHGTHVAGSVLGNGTLSGSDPSSHDYAGSFAGVAPEAGLVFQSIEDALGRLSGIPADLTDLFTPPYHDGARIHTNSWGGPTGGTPDAPEYGGYNVESQQADAMMWQHPDMLILFAAGNGGVDADANGVVDPDSVSTPGTAKNVVTVGASESLRPALDVTWGDGWPADYPAAPISDDKIADNASGMAAFSSRGPTDDGRIKPDVVAPGTYIISTRSHDPDAGVGWGVYNSDYLYMGGTSMATPLTAGAAVLVREWLTERQGVSNPSAALVKALLLNGAVNIAPGQYGNGSTQEVPAIRPNNVTGWGRVDLVESLNPSPPREIWFADNAAGLSTGSTAVYTLTVGQVANLSYVGDTALYVTAADNTPTPTSTPSLCGPFRVILVWSDYPGEPAAAKALVNDLDLEVIGPDGTHYYGNQGVYSGGQCLRGGKWDACNNIEGVALSSVLCGTYNVVVRAYNVAQGPQPFALAVSGDALREGSGTSNTLYVPLVAKD